MTNSVLSNVRAIFLTHMHSDHLADWPAVFVAAPANTAGRTFPAIKVYGPGDRGVLPRGVPARNPLWSTPTTPSRQSPE